jgi:hypothetical protein
LLFLLYINDLPGSINDLSDLYKLTLFADDTNIIFTHPNPTEFEEDINKLFEKIIIWFQINLLSLNLNKTYYTQLLSKTNYAVNMNISHKSNQISNVCHKNFFRSDVGQYTILEAACRSTYSLKSHIPLETLRMIYFSSVHSIISYGIIFWGNSSYSNTIFKLQKRAIRIMMNAGNKESCRELFKKIEYSVPTLTVHTLLITLCS